MTTHTFTTYLPVAKPRAGARAGPTLRIVPTMLRSLILATAMLIASLASSLAASPAFAVRIINLRQPVVLGNGNVYHHFLPCNETKRNLLELAKRIGASNPDAIKEIAEAIVSEEYSNSEMPDVWFYVVTGNGLHLATIRPLQAKPEVVAELLAQTPIGQSRMRQILGRRLKQFKTFQLIDGTLENELPPDPLPERTPQPSLTSPVPLPTTVKRIWKFMPQSNTFANGNATRRIFRGRRGKDLKSDGLTSTGGITPRGDSEDPNNEKVAVKPNSGRPLIPWFTLPPLSRDRVYTNNSQLTLSIDRYRFPLNEYFAKQLDDPAEPKRADSVREAPRESSSVSEKFGHADGASFPVADESNKPESGDVICLGSGFGSNSCSSSIPSWQGDEEPFPIPPLPFFGAVSSASGELDELKRDHFAPQTKWP